MNKNKVSSRELELFDSVQNLVKTGKFDKALEELRDIEESIESKDESLERAFLYRWFATIFNYMGDYVVSLAYAEKAYATNCGPKGDLHLFGKIRLLQSVSHHRTGNCLLAIEYGKEAMLAFKVTGDVRSQIASRNSLALILLDTGEIARADEVFKELSSNISKTEFPDFFDANLNNRVYVKNRLGQFKTSALIISEENISNVKYLPTKCCMRAERAFALMHLGRFDEAGKDLSRLYSLATINGLKRETLLYYEYFGLLKMIVGDYDAAEESFKRSLAATPEISSRSDMVSQVNRLLSELYLAKGDWEAASECGEAGLDVARRIPERVEIGACQRCLAQADIELGRPESALARFTEALELYTEFPHGYEMAKTRLCAAESGLFSKKESTEMQALANNYFTTEGLNQTSYQLVPSQTQ